MALTSINDEYVSKRFETLVGPLPGRISHRRFAPSLAYGRHFGPPSIEARRAAVALALCPTKAGELAIPLTVRPTALRHHGGQICLPGGRIENAETAVEAAIREFHEELKPSEVELSLLGILTPIYVYGSNNVVTPIVLLANTAFEFDPDPIEVESVIWMPLKTLSDESISSQELRRPVVGVQTKSSCSIHWSAPHWSIGEHRVWGATAMILSELASLLGGLET